MRKVTTVRAYLDEAALRLRGNLDSAEILADLEQAIADKCDTFLGAHKTVVSVSEVEQIHREMGPVDGAEPGASTAADAEDMPGAGAAPASEGQSRRKRLYRIPSEGMMGGVCAGLAAYANLDVAEAHGAPPIGAGMIGRFRRGRRSSRRWRCLC